VVRPCLKTAQALATSLSSGSSQAGLDGPLGSGSFRVRLSCGRTVPGTSLPSLPAGLSGRQCHRVGVSLPFFSFEKFLLPHQESAFYILKHSGPVLPETLRLPPGGRVQPPWGRVQPRGAVCSSAGPCAAPRGRVQLRGAVCTAGLVRAQPCACVRPLSNSSASFFESRCGFFGEGWEESCDPRLQLPLTSSLF
jgi:hypothetical protein